MTIAELLALPAAIDLDTANRALALGRTTGYILAKQGLYPCRVMRLGKAYRVATADLCRALGLEYPASASRDQRNLVHLDAPGKAPRTA